jgi:hypothetical protein
VKFRPYGLEYQYRSGTAKNRIKINEINNSLPPGVQVTVEKMNPSILQVIVIPLKRQRNVPPLT